MRSAGCATAAYREVWKNCVASYVYYAAPCMGAQKWQEEEQQVERQQ